MCVDIILFVHKYTRLLCECVGMSSYSYGGQFYFNTIIVKKYLLTSMPMEWCVKYLGPQKTFGVSGVNNVAAKSKTIEVQCVVYVF